MARVCTVCAHPERAEIDTALIGGDSNSGIARKYGLSEDAIRRHLAAHLAPATADAKRARERDLFAEVEGLMRRIDGALDRSEKVGDDRVLLLAVRETRATLELHAKMRGVLDERPQVNLVISPEWVSFRVTLLQALLPYPEARAAAAHALMAAETQEQGKESHGHVHTH
jgi:hypothetical protein